MNGTPSDSPFLLLNRDLAATIGTNEALVVQQIHYWISKQINFRDGRYWVYNSYPEWMKQFPFIKERTLRSTFRGLEDKGIIIAKIFNKKSYDRTKWYTINYEAPELTEWKKASPPPYPVDHPTYDVQTPEGYESERTLGDISTYTPAKSEIVGNCEQNNTRICIENNNESSDLEQYREDGLGNAVDKNGGNIEESPKSCGNNCLIVRQNLPHQEGNNCLTNTIEYTDITANNNNNRHSRDFSAQESAEKPRAQRQTPFDWKILEREIKKSCDNLDVNGELREDVIEVIEYYYDTYMWKNGKEHPRLSQEKMDDVVFRLIADTSDNGGSVFVLGDVADADSYKIMIDAYFATDFPNCDYSICHFVSGTIRDNRFYEKCYR